MSAWWLGGLGALVLGSWALTLYTRARAPGITGKLRARAAQELAARPRQPMYLTAPKSTSEGEQRFAALKAARPDASWNADGYSFQRFTDAGGRPIDEYGRPVSGISGNPLAPVLLAAQIALPFVPGVGPAASAALAAGIAAAKGKSLKNIAMAAARNAVPGGAAGQLAFDVGVAVASGERLDAAATVALLDRIPNGDRAFEVGARAALSSEQVAAAKQAGAL